MARYPVAVWKPLPENKTQSVIVPRAAILHSAVSKAHSLWGFFGRRDVVVESHFYVYEDGTVEQYMDTERQADANYKANPFAISIETWDGGNPDVRKWNEKQIAALTALLVWLCETHPSIRPRMIRRWNGKGIGYHSLFPGIWTPVRGKTCPGKARKPQVPEIIENVREAMNPVHTLTVPKSVLKKYIWGNAAIPLKIRLKYFEEK